MLHGAGIRRRSQCAFNGAARRTSSIGKSGFKVSPLAGGADAARLAVVDRWRMTKLSL